MPRVEEEALFAVMLMGGFTDPATSVCFTMLGPELFSAVEHSATQLRFDDL